MYGTEVRKKVQQKESEGVSEPVLRNWCRRHDVTFDADNLSAIREKYFSYVNGSEERKRLRELARISGEQADCQIFAFDEYLGRRKAKVKDTRLTVNQAWNDCIAQTSLEWLVEHDIYPPAARFDSDAELYRFKYKNYPRFQLSERNRRRLRKKTRGKLFNKIDAQAYNAIRKKAEVYAMSEVVGYTSHELRDHIESLFDDGMCWGRLSDIHIDHIVPCDLFDMESDEEVKTCWSLENLRPTWEGDNLSKSAKIDCDAIPDYLYQKLRDECPRVFDLIQC